MAIKVKVEKNIFAALATQLEPRKAKILAEEKAEMVKVARTLVLVLTGYLQSRIRATLTGIEARAEYAAIIEYGRLPGRPAQPYLTPAFELRRPILLRRLRDELFDERSLSTRARAPGTLSPDAAELE